MKSKLTGSGRSLMLAALLGFGGQGCQKRVPEPESRAVVPASSGSAAATSAASDPGAAAAAAAVPATAAPSGLIKDDIKIGTGPEARKGDHVFVHYTGTLTNGTKFDSSRDRNQPFDFTLGQGSVILGWDQGLLGMKVGGRRKLTIPSAMGYGPHGSPPVIPPNATLLFDVELVAIK